MVIDQEKESVENEWAGVGGKVSREQHGQSDREVREDGSRLAQASNLLSERTKLR